MTLRRFSIRADLCVEGFSSWIVETVSDVHSLQLSTYSNKLEDFTQFTWIGLGSKKYDFALRLSKIKIHLFGAHTK